MLTIRKEQIAVLEEYVRESFEENTLVYLKDKYPEQTNNKTDKEMIAFIREGIEKAAGYYINDRSDVLSFMEYMIFFGPDFEINPVNEWATEVFGIINLPGEEKMIRLINNKPLK